MTANDDLISRARTHRSRPLVPAAALLALAAALPLVGCSSPHPSENSPSAVSDRPVSSNEAHKQFLDAIEEAKSQFADDERNCFGLYGGHMDADPPEIGDADALAECLRSASEAFLHRVKAATHRYNLQKQLAAEQAE